MSDTKPFLFGTRSDRGSHHATSVWLLAGHKVRVNSTYIEGLRGEPDRAEARTDHFYDGQWREVLPHHAVEVAGAFDDDAHLALAKRTVEFLDDDARGPKWRDARPIDGSI